MVEIRMSTANSLCNSKHFLRETLCLSLNESGLRPQVCNKKFNREIQEATPEKITDISPCGRFVFPLFLDS